ncbi:MAG: hypothetical protein Ct9H300mP19_19430 [Dehalococcoidia bacterium]|nr:MAG: hypothetical protein Ct9H300mP19_19430 [Dehalococcoidia bacterium]
MIVRVDTDAGHHGLGEVGIRNWGRAIISRNRPSAELVVGAIRGKQNDSGKKCSDPVSSQPTGLYLSHFCYRHRPWDIKGKSVNFPNL